MSINRRPTVGVACVASGLILSAGIAVARHGNASLGEGPPIQFQSTAVPDASIRQFLDGNFLIIKDVKDLPRPVLKAFTEVGGSQPMTANPGGRFEATDFITDSSMPRERLIFAGVSGDDALYITNKVE